MEEFGTVPAPGNREEQLMRALVDTAGALIICTAPPEPRTVRAAAEPFTWAANSERLHAFLSHLAA